MRAGQERVSRFIETNVAVDADAKQQQIDPTAAGDRFLVAFALDGGIDCNAVEAVHAFGIKIDAGEQVLRDEAPETPGLRSIEAEEFVEQKDSGPSEIGFSGRMEATQFAVGVDGRSSRGQAEDEVRTAAQSLTDPMREGAARREWSLENSDVHWLSRTAASAFHVPRQGPA